MAPPGVIVIEVTLLERLREDEGAVVVVPALPQRLPLASKTQTATTFPPETVIVTAVVSVEEKFPYVKDIPAPRGMVASGVATVAITISFSVD
jgi:hypothetical protein